MRQLQPEGLGEGRTQGGSTPTRCTPQLQPPPTLPLLGGGTQQFPSLLGRGEGRVEPSPCKRHSGARNQSAVPARPRAPTPTTPIRNYAQAPRNQLVGVTARVAPAGERCASPSPSIPLPPRARAVHQAAFPRPARRLPPTADLHASLHQTAATQPISPSEGEIIERVPRNPRPTPRRGQNDQLVGVLPVSRQWVGGAHHPLPRSLSLRGRGRLHSARTVTSAQSPPNTAPPTTEPAPPPPVCHRPLPQPPPARYPHPMPVTPPLPTAPHRSAHQATAVVVATPYPLRITFAVQTPPPGTINRPPGTPRNL